MAAIQPSPDYSNWFKLLPTVSEAPIGRKVPIAYVVGRDFKQTLNGSVLSFNKGAVIVDRALIDALTSSRAPIDPAYASHDIHQCPHCKRFFTEAQSAAKGG